MNERLYEISVMDINEYGFPHNETGPAITYCDGGTEYWYDGIFYENIKDNQQWYQTVLKIKLLKS